MRHFSWALLFSALFWALCSTADVNNTEYAVAIDSKNGYFMFPRTFPLTFKEGSIVTIKWSTSFRNATLWILQPAIWDSDGYQAWAVEGLAAESLAWRVNVKSYDTNDIFVCFIENGDSPDDEGFWSAGFYIERLAQSRSSSGLSTSISTSTLLPKKMSLSGLPPGSTRTGTVVSIPAQGTSAEAPRYTPPITSKPESLPTGGIVRLIVGLCAAAIIIAIVGVLVWRRRRQRRASKQLATADDGSDSTPNTDELTSSNPKTHNYTPVPNEAEMRQTQTEEEMIRAELPAVRERPRAEDLDELIS